MPLLIVQNSPGQNGKMDFIITHIDFVLGDQSSGFPLTLAVILVV